MKRVAFLLILLFVTIASADVKTVRVPDGGIQPQAAVDANGTIHVIYYKGPDNAGDLFYVRSEDGGKAFSPALRVNSQPGSALAIGAVRGAHLSLGRDGIVHVSWMGSNSARPKGPRNSTPLLYTRLADHGEAFEPQKGVIAEHPGLDGGPSLAADGAGHVYIAWHAPLAKDDGEQGRLVWLAKSNDDGKTFEKEFAMTTGDRPGACACCALNLTVAPIGAVVGLFRKADQKVNRGTMFFATDAGVTKPAVVKEIAPMKYGACLLSTCAIIADGDHAWAAYETTGDLFLQKIEIATGKTLATAPAGKGKYPSLMIGKDGQMLIARAVGTAWNKGGTIAWEGFDPSGQPMETLTGQARDLPAWSYPAAVALADGDFLIFY